MAGSLSNLIDNCAEDIFIKFYKIKYKYGHENKMYETCRIKYKNCECCLEYINLKDDLMEYKCLC